MTVRHPPGRAGRLWLRERLDVARRATTLLERKRDLLRRQQRRLAELAQRTGVEWEHRCQDAGRWAERAFLTGGRDELARAAARTADARVVVGWRTEAGVTYPATIRAQLPTPAPQAGPAALAFAARAHAAALDAAAAHAAATAAHQRVSAELAATGRRMRAIRDLWIPRLEATLADVELHLDETEREEHQRRRWAAGPGPAAGSAP